MFDNKTEEKVQAPTERIYKQLDESKTAFLNQTIETKQSSIEITPGQLDQNKIHKLMKEINDSSPAKNNHASI